MKVIDITGVLYNGMWNYEPPFPTLAIRPLPEVEWVETKVYCDIFDGIHSQSGTYLETPAHLLGDKSYPLEERCAITREMLERENIEEGKALLISCNWGRHWRDSRYLSASPYFTYEAMEYIVSKKPPLLGTDFARWENLDAPEGFFPMFYDANILMLAPCVNLEKIEKKNVSLTALPLNIEKTCCAPCRAFVKE